jgi:hypothetical protein
MGWKHPAVPTPPASIGYRHYAIRPDSFQVRSTEPDRLITSAFIVHDPRGICRPS